MNGFKNVKAGRYAITGKDGKTVRFFRVDAPGGKYNEHRFVKELHADGGYGAESLRATRVPSKAFEASVLAYVAAHPETLPAFGKALGVCGICGRALTDDASLAAGIGPVCATK